MSKPPFCRELPNACCFPDCDCPRQYPPARPSESKGEAVAAPYVPTPSCESCGYTESHDPNCPRPSEKPERELHEARDILFKALGWTFGDLASAAFEVVKRLEAAQSARVPCIYEARARDGEPFAAWCRTHGFDCPNGVVDRTTKP